MSIEQSSQQMTLASERIIFWLDLSQDNLPQASAIILLLMHIHYVVQHLVDSSETTGIGLQLALVIGTDHFVVKEI